MEETVLAVRGLSKRYGHFSALSGVNLSMTRGQIYGLVGKNGAGKTTLMRLVTGQALPNEGEIELFGRTDAGGLNRARRRTGAMIETPSFYPYLTARENLEYYRIQRGIAGRELIDELLSEVELAEAGKKKFRDFSLGMKQRLGLALALMNSPDMLILDEPVNGLDPMGIVKFRNLLLKLNQERGISILISSHILSELSNLATFYGFIDRGNLIEEISAQSLNEKCRQYIELQVSDAEKAAAALEQKLGCIEYEVLPGNILHVYRYLDDPMRVSGALASAGVGLASIEVRGANLEDYFLRLIGGGERNA